MRKYSHLVSSVILYDSVCLLYSISLMSFMYCTILYSPVLSCTVSYYTVLYCTVLHTTVVYTYHSIVQYLISYYTLLLPYCHSHISIRFISYYISSYHIHPHIISVQSHIISSSSASWTSIRQLSMIVSR